MNKLMGFLELKEMMLPSIPWRQYKRGDKLGENQLWTIRSAVYRGNDLNLPRKVGVDAKSAEEFALALQNQLGNRGIVIYYPYFIARKSGTLEIRNDGYVIEAVNEDLWNLVSYSNREVTIINSEFNGYSVHGNERFINKDELEEITKYIPEIKKIFRDDLLEGRSALLEWSYAISCDDKKNPINDEYLVFYEARTV